MNIAMYRNQTHRSSILSKKGLVYEHLCPFPSASRTKIQKKRIRHTGRAEIRQGKYNEIFRKQKRASLGAERALLSYTQADSTFFSNSSCKSESVTNDHKTRIWLALHKINDCLDPLWILAR
jgi:hypothetical protein